MGSCVSGLGDTPVTGEPWCTWVRGVLLCDLYSPAPGDLCRADGRMCVKPGDQAEGWAVVGTAWIYSLGYIPPTACLCK